MIAFSSPNISNFETNFTYKKIVLLYKINSELEI